MGLIDDLLIEKLNNSCNINCRKSSVEKEERKRRKDFENTVNDFLNLTEEEKNNGKIKEIRDKDGNLNGFEFSSSKKGKSKEGVSEAEKWLLMNYENDNGEFDFTKIKDIDFLNKMVDVFERYADEKDGVKHNKVFSKEILEPITFDECFNGLFPDMHKCFSELFTDEAKNTELCKLSKKDLSDVKEMVSNIVESVKENAEKKEKETCEKKECVCNHSDKKEICCEDKCECASNSERRKAKETTMDNEVVRFWAPTWNNEFYFLNAVNALLEKTFFNGKKIKGGMPKSGETVVIMLNDREKLLTATINRGGELLRDNVKVYIISPTTFELRRIFDEKTFEEYRMNPVHENAMTLKR